MLKRFGFITGTIAAAGIFGVTVAMAVLTGSTGGTTIQVQNRAETAASFTNAAAFVDLPGANVVVTVPAGTSRLISARFTAESQCFGQAGRWCSLRVIVSNVAGGFVEMQPASGLDYAFDTVAADVWEGHALERSLRVGAGTYRVRVQRAVSGAGATFRLDDWHFRVDLNA